MLIRGKCWWEAWVRSVYGLMLMMDCARRGLPAAGRLLSWGLSWGVTAVGRVCLARTDGDVDKGFCPGEG